MLVKFAAPRAKFADVNTSPFFARTNYHFLLWLSGKSRLAVKPSWGGRLQLVHFGEYVDYVDIGRARVDLLKPYYPLFVDDDHCSFRCPSNFVVDTKKLSCLAFWVEVA